VLGSLDSREVLALLLGDYLGRFFMANEVDADVYAVILAGGSGTRFWPKSRQKTPKQLCRLGGASETMIEMTLRRLDGFIPPERRIVVTHVDQAALTKQKIGNLCASVISEPEARNTANALALAALEITKKAHGKTPIMVSLHADHVIEKVDVLNDKIRTAINVAKAGELCLLGVVPRYPETGYGYIEKGSATGVTGVFKVASFREKPDEETAKKYVASKKFFWNAGLFVFPVRVLLEEIKAKLPQTVAGLAKLLDTADSFAKVDFRAFADLYAQLPKISIDHAVLEVSRRVSVIEADIGWQDVGSWDALSQCFATDKAGNYTEGDVLVIDSHDCTIDSDGPLTVLLGMRDTVVVHARGAILVCPKDRAQDVKLIVDALKSSGRSEFV
jgi:mannose-1-phosphate guanylyltransferase